MKTEHRFHAKIYFFRMLRESTINIHKKELHEEAPFSGERGIRTPGPVTVNSFQDYRNRPLCHLSKKQNFLFFSGANIVLF